MEKLRNYTTIFDAGSQTTMDALEDLLAQYENFSLLYNDDGTYTLTFTGDATQAQEEMNGLATGLRALEDEYGENAVFDSLIDYTTSSLSGVEEILETYQNVYEQANLAELVRDTTELKDVLGEGLELPEGVDTYSDLYKKYAEAVEDYNEALLDGDASKIADAKDQFEAVDTVVQDLMGDDNMGGYGDLFNEIADSLDTASIAAQDFNSALSGDGAISEIDSWSAGELSNQIFDLANAGNSLVDTWSWGGDEVSSSLVQIMNAAEEAGVVTSENGQYTEEQINTVISLLESLGYIASDVLEDSVMSVSDLSTAFASAEETVEGLTTAISESASATGLSADSITLVESAYEDLEGYDASKLFEATTTGVHLNRQALEALDKACFILAGIDTVSLLQAVDAAVEMNKNGDHGIPVPDYIEENVSTKVVKIIQSYTRVVDKMVWRKES